MALRKLTLKEKFIVTFVCIGTILCLLPVPFVLKFVAEHMTKDLMLGMVVFIFSLFAYVFVRNK